MMVFPGGKVRDVSESFLSVPEKRASLAAEQENAAEARDQLVASRPAPERVAIRMSEIGLRDVETCDNTATSDTGDVMGVPNDPQADGAIGDLSAPRQRAFEFRLLDLGRLGHYLAGHDSRHVS
jgi:hypothetical protein